MITMLLFLSIAAASDTADHLVELEAELDQSLADQQALCHALNVECEAPPPPAPTHAAAADGSLQSDTAAPDAPEPDPAPFPAEPVLQTIVAPRTPPESGTQ